MILLFKEHEQELFFNWNNWMKAVNLTPQQAPMRRKKSIMMLTPAVPTMARDPNTAFSPM